MYATAIDELITSQPAACLGGEFGYRMEGDSASLNAALAVLDEQQLAAADWALQLWACDADANGRLQGIKVAEVALGALHGRVSDRSTVAGDTIALPPAGHGAHTMVLALASGTSGHYGQIHDFAVFGTPQHFTQPRLDGVVGYKFGEQSVRLSVERIENPREAGSTSGTLALELWALDSPYSGGAFAGSLLGGVQLGSLDGQSYWREVSVNADTAALAAGNWNLVLMLREWTPAGFVTRDYSNFAAPHLVAAVETTGAPAEALVEAPAAATTASEPKAAAAAPAAQGKAPAKAEAVNTVASAVKADAPATKPNSSAASVATAEAKAPAEERTAAQAKAPAEAKATTAPAAVPARVEAAVAKPAAAAPKATTPTAAVAKPAVEAKVAAIETERKPAASSPIVKTARSLPSVNAASADELAAIKGLSKTLAKAIIAARPYKSLEELTRAKGVDHKLVDKLRQQLSL